MLLLLLDLIAIFDMVDYNLMTYCPIDVGTWGSALQWLVSFLHRWEHSVELGEKGFSMLPFGM